MTFGLLPKQPDRGQSCACPHLFVSGCFTRPPGTSTRNHPHEPTTSKPVVPGGYVCVLSIEPDHVRIGTRWPRFGTRRPRFGTRGPRFGTTRPHNVDERAVETGTMHV